jgi:hypothetical protein
MKRNLLEVCGWIGMVLIHGSTLPVTLSLLMGWSNEVPPLSMVLLVWTGLFLFFLRAIGRFDFLYLVSNGVGWLFQTALLILVLQQ